MFQGVNLIKAIVVGLIAGIILGLFTKWIEALTDLKVYTLLMNIDYIPIIKEIDFPEIIEFSFHLIVSVLLIVLLHIFLVKRNWKGNRILFYTGASLVVGLLLFPSTVLSERTPELTDMAAFFFWMLAHGLYGVIAGYLLRRG